MANFYGIFIDPKPSASRDDVKKKMDLAIDWFRYDEKNWIVYTSSEAAKWYSRLQSLAVPDGHVFIVKLDLSDRSGWMSKQLWAWIKKRKGSD